MNYMAWARKVGTGPGSDGIELGTGTQKKLRR